MRLTLAGFEALVHLVDDVNTATATHKLVVAVTPHQRFERIANFHLFSSIKQKEAPSACGFGAELKANARSCQRTPH